MGLLAKVSPNTAGVDTLLYVVPAGKKATVNINVANRNPSPTVIGLAIMGSTDLVVDTVSTTVKGSGYSAIPLVTVTGENTAPASVVVDNMAVAAAAINAAGAGYAVNDILNLVVTGGTMVTQAKLKVLAVNGGGAITSFEINDGGSYTVLGTAATVTGGSGTGATFNGVTWGINAVRVITKGNGYKAVPTLAATGGNGAVLTPQMSRVVEADDFFETAVTISQNGPLERTGVVLSEGQSLYIRATEANAANAHVWGFESLA